MELPKNITQIGEPNLRCRIYVEDYVVSYIKQLNRQAEDKRIAVGLYGARKEEEDVTWLFLYGACRLSFLERECRHLSQAVMQEAEKQRGKYFPEYAFLGYSLLDGEMTEGFYVCDRNVCRYVEGYAQFYEKNDCMLSLMLEERQGEAKPESVDQEKYNVVKKRQEERRALSEEKGARIIKYRSRPSGRQDTVSGKGTLRSMRLTAAAVFVLLCGTGLAVMSGGADNLRTAAEKLMEDMTQKQLPDAVEVSNGSAQAGVIVTEDRLTDAIRKENVVSETGESGQAASPEPQETAGAAETTPEPTPAAVPEPAPTTAPDPATPEPAPTPEPVSYTVQRGDTLIGICIKKYGSDARVADICSLNNISDPDDIREGTRILLP